MISKDDVRHIREVIGQHSGPMLSLYIDVDPARPENERKAWLLRAKNSLSALDIPVRQREKPLQQQVIAVLEEERPHARTLALFAAQDLDLLERYDLQVDLPIVDLAHGRVEARWGEPYITPLLYALVEYERAGVLWLDRERERWRFYQVFLGEIEEETETFRDLPEEWRELKRCDPAEHEGLYTQRMGSDRDQHKARLAAWEHRFYKRLAHLLEHVVAKLEIQRLVLLGTEPDTAFFEQQLSRSLRNRVTARVSNIPEEDASLGAVLEKVAPVLERAERADEEQLLDRIREQPGVWGIGPTLDTLQYGRVVVLVAPWSLQANVWRCLDGWVGTTKEAARLFCPDQEPREVALRDVIADLAVDFGSRLEFMRGEPEVRLLKEYQGLAGLLRY